MTAEDARPANTRAAHPAAPIEGWRAGGGVQTAGHSVPPKKTRRQEHHTRFDGRRSANTTMPRLASLSAHVLLSSREEKRGVDRRSPLTRLPLPLV